ncbi:MAG: cardiolipin synthase [Pseudomonadota bacterium]|nr:cardiolipin synthase [Pseudomonadota bacterium]
MEFWYSLFALFITVLAVLLSAHIVLVKREPRAALLWVTVLWLVPFLGAILYLLFGVNRIRRRAYALNRPRLQHLAGTVDTDPRELRLALGRGYEHLLALRNLGDRVTNSPLLPGNAITLLVDGDEAFPEMLKAISQATKNITLSTYIFGNDRIGQGFVKALVAAMNRGVEVRVLIDAAGERYSWPSIVGVLQKAGIPVARFLPHKPNRLVGLNLRNHRKLLVVDGRIGFTGGMNIRVHHLQNAGRRSTRDLHFRLEGPIVGQLQEVFVQDWAFSDGEILKGEDWFPELRPIGRIFARGVPDGPDEDLEKLVWTLHGALSLAKRRVRIMTPYFLPDRALVTALNLAALRGVKVDIVLPSKNNLPYVQWAMMGQIWQVLQHGCRVWLTPKPFDHTKLMVVDEAWGFVGSANWDPRSLRLNFEYNVEFYDRELAHQLDSLVVERIATATPCTLETVDNRALPVKLRDGIARLATPIL